MIPRLCYQNRITDREATPCSVERLRELMKSAEVQAICDEIKLLDGRDKDELARLKRQLPVITPHAQRFTDNERKNQNAIPSGLCMLDIDDVEDPIALSHRLDGTELKRNDIYFVAITPSGHGLRVIAERQPQESLQAAQQRLASLYGVAQYDSSTKDPARTSFIMPLSYLLYMDESGLEFADQETADKVRDSFLNTNSTNDALHTRAQSPQGEYRGIAYSAIVEQLVNLLGGAPQQGERNTFYFTLVKYIRYICDFSASQVLAVLPDFGLSADERQAVITSAINRPRKECIPDMMQRAIAAAEVEESVTDRNNAAEMHNNEELLPALPKLPKVLDIICKHLPEAFRPAMVIAALPILGTLATRIRFKYLDHATHSFSFFSMITAPAATGKSFIRNPINLLLTPIDERDEEERAKQMAYEEERRKCKNSKHQPEDPHACPRNNGVTISIAKLLQLMTYAEGKHLLGVGEEIDTLLKSENAGAWSKKGDIYRLAFDNASYSQQYMSDNSFSTKVDVYYNLLITGTPNGMYRFFKDVEDGLVTRVAFAQLPDMRYTRMPEFVPFSDREQKQIIESARYLDEQKGCISCPAVDKVIDQWLEEKRIAADQAQSSAMDTLRRRSAVIGFRAGYLAALMEEEKSRFRSDASYRTLTGLSAKRAADFALWVAEYVFQQQMALFGDKFDAVAKQQEACLLTNRGNVRSLLSQLPNDFQRAELINVRARNHQSTEVKVLLSRWIKAGYISRNDDGSYHKVTARCV